MISHIHSKVVSPDLPYDLCIFRVSVPLNMFFFHQISSNFKSPKNKTSDLPRSHWALFFSTDDDLVGTDDTQAGWIFIPEEMGFFHQWVQEVSLFFTPKKPKGVNVKPLKRLPSPGLHWRNSMSTWRVWRSNHETSGWTCARWRCEILMMQPDPQSLNGVEVRNQGKLKELDDMKKWGRIFFWRGKMCRFVRCLFGYEMMI